MKFYSDCLLLTSYLGFILNIVPRIFGAECPPDAPQRASQCVASFSGTSKSNNQSLLSDWDLEKIGQACKDEIFSRGIRCAENIITSCKDDRQQAEYLNKYLDVPLLRQGVSRLCTHTIKDLKHDSKCIRDQKPTVKQCADAQLSEFQYKVSQLEGDLDRILEAACEFMHKVFECQSTNVRINCGQKPADELTKITSYFIPPYCANKGIEPGHSGSEGPHLQIITVLTAGVLSLLCYEMFS